jgi:serine O-acetyltransferase
VSTADKADHETKSQPGGGAAPAQPGRSTGRQANPGMAEIVEALCAPAETELAHYGRQFRNMLLPARHHVLHAVEELKAVLFPGFFGFREFSPDSLRFHVGAKLDEVLDILRHEIDIALRFVEGHTYERSYAAPGELDSVLGRFTAALPEIRRRLLLDATACFEGDPAAFIPEAPIFCYPNVHAMISYRLAHELYLLGVPFIPRIITEHAHSQTGIDIHPGAQIGESCFIDHGTGVVIGQTAIVGDRVRLYQGVTLGAKSFPIDERTQRPLKGIPRHPIVEDDVVIFAEATILGRVTIGHHSVIGANVFLARSIPPCSKVFQAPVRMQPVAEGEGAPPTDNPYESVGGG